jgi:glycosyltransferase involved in cell wall biosynthesis
LPPLTADEPEGLDAPGDHLLAAGLLSDVNRFAAIVDAFGNCPRIARLHILAQRTAREQSEFLEQAIRASPRAAEISLEVDFPPPRFLQLARSAAAFVSIPFRQASLDVHSMTAIRLGRPFVTTADSGEPARFVQDAGVSTVPEATPAALAEAIEALASNRKLAERQAAKLAESLRHQLPTWDVVAAELAK